jgi:hypothetical protein
MQRTLPPRPNLEHLKKQAKDLLDAHHRKEDDALARIRAALPAFASMNDDEIGRSPFALHDAQSAIAREYGFKSWSELREAVAAKSAVEQAPSIALLRALMPVPMPDVALSAIAGLGARRSEALAVARAKLPDALPLVPLRDAFLVPGAVAPIHLGRGSSLAALDAALARNPSTLAVFAQRAAGDEDVSSADSLHPVGVEAIVYTRIPEGERAFAVLEGVRWIRLESVEQHGDGYLVACVAAVLVERDRGDVATVLTESLRARARELAKALPDAGPVLGMIDTFDDVRLADLVIANLPVAVADKARYASELRLVERLRIACDLIGAPVADRV